MTADGRPVLWTQFILATALARAVRTACVDQGQDDGEPLPFCYTDTHAGCGHLHRPPAGLAAVLGESASFANGAFFAAVVPMPEHGHPGSWVLAARVLNGFGQEQLAPELDINDIDPGVIAAAGNHRPAGVRLRYWTHDWFQFLRSRLQMARLPDFVFIDPPPDDPRGPAYAIDAAILLDTLAIPYMLSYPAEACQDAIDQIGRTGLEFAFAGGGQGALLGGGAEGAMLDMLADLRRLATILGGGLVIRVPRCDDYSI